MYYKREACNSTEDKADGFVSYLEIKKLML
jgi:hypothetical protein